MALNFETVTKKDLMNKGYTSYYATGIIRQAKALLVREGCHYYEGSYIDRVPEDAVIAILLPKALQGQEKER